MHRPRRSCPRLRVTSCAGQRCGRARPSATAPSGPSVTTKRRSLRRATPSSSSISAASRRLQAEQPDVELGSPARCERDGVADVVGVREVDRAQSRWPARHDRLEEREPLAERGRRQHVAAGDGRALALAHAEAGQDALVVALEDALAAGRLADVLDGRRVRARPRGTARRRSAPCASRTIARPASSPTGATAVTVSPGAHSRRSVHGDVQPDAAGALEVRDRRSGRPRSRPRRRTSRARRGQRRHLLRRRAPVRVIRLVPTIAPSATASSARGVAGASPLPTSTGQLARSVPRGPHARPATGGSPVRVPVTTMASAPASRARGARIRRACAGRASRAYLTWMSASTSTRSAPMRGAVGDHRLGRDAHGAVLGPAHLVGEVVGADECRHRPRARPPARPRDR